MELYASNGTLERQINLKIKSLVGYAGTLKRSEIHGELGILLEKNGDYFSSL